MGVVVGIQPLLVVPAVSSGTGELDPFVVVLWCGALGGEVAARAHLYDLADGREEERWVEEECGEGNEGGDDLAGGCYFYGRGGGGGVDECEGVERWGRRGEGCGLS